MKLDSDTIERIKNRDRKTELKLYQECFPFFMSVAYKFYKEESEAAMAINDTFVKLCSHIKKYDNRLNFLTWSKTILIRVILNDLRKKKKEKKVTFNTDKINEVFSEPGKINEYDTKYMLKRMSKKLPRATKNVFELFYIEGLDHEEISEYLTISEETSRWHIKKGKKIIRSTYFGKDAKADNGGI